MIAPEVTNFELESLGTATMTVELVAMPCADEKTTLATLVALFLQVPDSVVAPLLIDRICIERELESVTGTPALFDTDSVPFTPTPDALLRETARVSASALTVFVTFAVRGVTARASSDSAEASMSVLATLKGVADRRLGDAEDSVTQVPNVPCVHV